METVPGFHVSDFESGLLVQVVGRRALGNVARFTGRRRCFYSGSKDTLLRSRVTYFLSSDCL